MDQCLNSSVNYIKENVNFYTYCVENGRTLDSKCFIEVYCYLIGILNGELYLLKVEAIKYKR